MGDVIDRLIAGERVDTLSREDIDAVYTWVDDPRNGISPPMRRLITLLVYELRAHRRQPPPPGMAYDNLGTLYPVEKP